MKILILILLPLFCLSQRIIVDKAKVTNVSKTVTANISHDKNIVYVGNYYGDYSSVEEALDSITDASASNVYTIMVDTGTYTIDQANEFNLNGSTYSYFKTKDYANIQGAGIGSSIINASLPDTTSYTIGNYSAVDFYGTQAVSGLTIIAENIKYCIHDDFSTTTTVNINDCKLIHNGCMTYYNYNLPTVKTIYQSSYGCGTKSGRVINFDNVTFDGNAYFHTNKDFSTRSKITFNDCVFIPRAYNANSTLTSGLSLQSLNSLKSDTVSMVNCSLDSITYSWYAYQSDTALLPYNFAEIQVISDNSHTFNNFSLFNTTNGSLMIVATDSIRFVSGSNLIRNPENLGDTLISKLEVGEWTGCPNAKMGVRLGDCSVSNKTINLVVNGTPCTITFNESFTAQTNAYILSFINSQLTGAVASLYSWGLQYNPF